MINYYRSENDPVWEKGAKKNKSFFDEMREYTLQTYNSSLTSFIEAYTEMTAEQALQDDDDLMLMANSGRSPKEVADILFEEYRVSKAQKTILGGVV